MNSIQNLIQFLQKHHLLILSTSRNNTPHSTPLFYAFDSENMRLIFTSEVHTRHMQEILKNNSVSAGIYLETEEIGLIQGAQVWGKAEISQDSELQKCYFQRFPMSRAFLLTQAKHDFCALKMEKVRIIDNKLGFGKKLEWSFDV